MKTVRLQRITIKNFRSFIEAVIEFPDTQGLKLLSGQNVCEPKLGANGAGKTSLLDAICWSLTGYSTSGARLASLINWSATELSVELLILINDVPTTIKRYGPPMRIELNGEIVTQEKLDSIFGLSRLRFIHSVIFGQGANLFPDLSIPERGDLLDEVLALNTWQKAAEAAGEKCNSIEKLLSGKKTELAYTNGRLSSLQTDAELEKESTSWETDKKAQVASFEFSSKKWDLDRQNQITNLQVQAQNWSGQQATKIKELEDLREAWKEEKINLAEKKVRELESTEANLAPLQFEIDNYMSDPFSVATPLLQKQVNEWEEVRERSIEVLHKAEHSLAACYVAVKLWENDTCPTCNQAIDKSKKAHELACTETLKTKLRAERDEAEISIEQLTIKIADFTNQIRDNVSSTVRSEEKKRSLEKEVASIRKQVNLVEVEARKLYAEYEQDPYTKQIDLVQKDKSPYEKQVAVLQKQVNPFATQMILARSAVNPFIVKLREIKLERDKLSGKLVAQQNEYNEMAAKQTAAEYWKHGFKRIRLYFVKQVLTTLQIEIQSAISGLGLDGWKVDLATETETKSATVKLGVQINIESPQSKASWDVWSGGEKQRLRLAIAMGLGSLIQRAAGVYFTFEVWDEPTQHLSGEGVTDLLDSLHYRAENNKKQIWIVDHSALHYSAFSEVWTIVKEKTGSQMQRASSSV